ncbi:uncharacterized protein TRIREDRAFT_59112 [Trichoderma reesei QM6a]|uniref:Predicted protein n=2 Tax=Hypocrea jecorina TaxID=51453 RepID=G0REU6_HYPJQ|nr:uncharacterized protein TRIREDRAFT_59112 [Trichoderma reesei QM6a]EGR50182.1 predicted protein [Trichoderma reesei QM6a]
MDNSNAATTPDEAEKQQVLDELKAIDVAMQRLKLLHIKARRYQGLIPTMLEPLVQKHRSPEAMYAAFMKSVADAQAKISDFRDLMTDETSTEAFARAAKSREERPDGIAPWRYDNYPEWFNADKHWTK